MESAECILDTGFIHLEPHSIGSGKGKKFGVKRSIRDSVSRFVPPDDLEAARAELLNELVNVQVWFHLFPNPPSGTNTRIKKDLDNLVKPVLDVLQPWMDAGSTEKGLGIIDSDSRICELHSWKELCERPEDEGIRIRIFKHDDDKMRAVLME